MFFIISFYFLSLIFFLILGPSYYPFIIGTGSANNIKPSESRMTGNNNYGMPLKPIGGQANFTCEEVEVFHVVRK